MKYANSFVMLNFVIDMAADYSGFECLINSFASGMSSGTVESVISKQVTDQGHENFL